MSMLSAFAGGAARGVQTHWAEVRDKVAAEARMMFQERLADKQYERGRADQLADREYSVDREAEIYGRNRSDQMSDEQRGIDQKKELALWEKENLSAPAERWENVVDEQGNVVNQRNSKTGALKWSPKERGTGGASSGKFKTNLEPLSMGENMDYPNIWVDTKTGYVVDPRGQLTQSTADEALLKSQVEDEIKERRGGVMGMGKKSDKEAFGTSEENYRKLRFEQLQAEAPTLAGELGFSPDKVLRSEKELEAIYQQQGIQAPAASQPKQVAGVTFDPAMFADEPGQKKPAAQSEPESVPTQKEPAPERITDAERALLKEMNVSLGEKAPRHMSPYADADPLGAIGDFVAEKAPVTTRVLGGLLTQPAESAKAYGGMLSRAGEAIMQKHRDMVASGDRMKARDKARMTEKLTKAFFNGEPTVYAARAVLESTQLAADSKEKRAAKAYLKAKGQQ